MKKIPDQIERTFRFIRLYLDDYEKLVEIVREEKGEELEVTVGTYQLNSPNEIKDVASQEETVNWLIIENRLEGIQVVGNRHGATVICRSDTPSVKGRYHIICELLSRRKLSLLPFLASWVGLISMTVFMIVGMFLLRDSVLVLLPSLLYLGIHTFTSLTKKFELMLKDRKEAPNFWKRNKDTIIVKVIGGIILFILGAIANQFLLK